MLDHASIGVCDLEASAALYDSVLTELGYARRKSRLAARVRREVRNKLRTGLKNPGRKS